MCLLEKKNQTVVKYIEENKEAYNYAEFQNTPLNNSYCYYVGYVHQNVFSI